MHTLVKILLVDPDLEARSRLREALRAIYSKAEFSMLRSVSEALNKLAEKEGVDLIFLASRPQREALPEALEKLNAYCPSKDTGIIVTLGSDDQDTSFVTELYVSGAHGFICEPYSPDALQECITTAREELANSRNKSVKDKRAADFLLRKAMSLIDTIAQWKDSGKKGRGPAGKELKEVRRVLHNRAGTLEPGEWEAMLLERLPNATTKKKAPAEVKQAKPKKIPIHPGVELRTLMANRSISKEKVLSVAKIDAQMLEAILLEQAAFTEEIARDIARAVGQTAGHWIGLQRKWDDYQKLIERERAAH